MKKKAQVHLLPTDKASKILLCHNDYLQFDEDYGKNYVKNCIEFKNLFFTTDEEIKEGDWISGDNEIIMADDSWSDEENNGVVNEWRKIAATTNPDLWNQHIDCPSGKYSHDEPHWMYDDTSKPVVGKIGYDFIQAYIKAHNEQKPITEIMLEYEMVRNIGSIIVAMSPLNTELNSDMSVYYNSLKLRSNGTVIIHPAKERMFTKKDLELAFAEGVNAGVLIKELPTPRIRFKEWFNKNYPE
jgi:hypothetical protein